jgi:hypothetical protein
MSKKVITGGAWSDDASALKCPACGRNTVGILRYINEHGAHMHTRYLCASWPSGAGEPCGWAGWYVPNAQTTPM